MQLRAAASGTRSSSSLLLFADVRGVCASAYAVRQRLLHNSSACQKALGAAQNALLQAAAALVPGVSRSGATITIALFFGLRRAEAARFTFLLGIPAILGAAVLEFPDMLEQGLHTTGSMPFVVRRYFGSHSP